MDWTDIALPAGSPAAGNLTIAFNVILPEGVSDDFPTERQLDAISLFFGRDLSVQTFDQANAVLSARDFALRSSQTLNKRLGVNAQRLLAVGLAAFILCDKRSTDYVCKWGERVFNQGSTTPRVKGTPLFPELESFNLYLLGMLEMDGWTEELLK